MDFDQTEERRLIADTVAKFIAKDYPIENRVKAANSEIGFSTDNWAKIHELGIPYALFSEEFNGFGGDGFDIASLFEALGKGLIVEPLLISLISGDILSFSKKHSSYFKILFLEIKE